MAVREVIGFATFAVSLIPDCRGSVLPQGIFFFLYVLANTIAALGLALAVPEVWTGVGLGGVILLFVLLFIALAIFRVYVRDGSRFLRTLRNWRLVVFVITSVVAAVFFLWAITKHSFKEFFAYVILISFEVLLVAMLILLSVQFAVTPFDRRKIFVVAYPIHSLLVNIFFIYLGIGIVFGFIPWNGMVALTALTPAAKKARAAVPWITSLWRRTQPISDIDKQFVDESDVDDREMTVVLLPTGAESMGNFTGNVRM